MSINLVSVTNSPLFYNMALIQVNRYVIITSNTTVLKS